MFERGAKCSEIAAVIGYKTHTVEGSATKWGWTRKQSCCYKCGASVPQSRKTNSADRRVCRACELQRYRDKKSRISPEKKIEYRRREAERLGKTYKTIEQYRAEIDQRRASKPRSPFSELGRYRYYGEFPRSQAGALLALRDTLSALLKVRCEAEGITTQTAQYRWRYQTDPAFRAKEKAKAAGRKSRRITHMKRDGTLTGDVVRRLFATASVCPYCDKLMTRDDKTLDHMTPVSLGGAHGIGNVTVCCYSCNSRKVNLPFSAWLAKLPAHIAARFTTVRAA